MHRPPTHHREQQPRGVIEFDRVTKVYPGATERSVNNLTLRVEAGEICALVGPSGSGKTTAMRMVNRLIEPTSGEIRIDGRATAHLPVEELRRSIGYVIQQVGLFPHRTVFDNVGTVPRLLGWDDATILRRSTELLELVGLDPHQHGNRYPAQLSGGQRQRVGVARALAADPPVMLMDEPFGAIDPVVREQIQNEFLRMQRDVCKTIILVTHDLDEAMRMGDKVAILREGGILAQYGTPDELLSAPADEFVREFVGGDAALRRLALRHVNELPLIPLDVAAHQGFGMYVDAEGRPAQWASGAPIAATVSIDASLRSALAELIGSACPYAPVVDAQGRPIALITQDLVAAALQPLAPPAPAITQAPQTAWEPTLRFGAASA